ncbi:MAG TPA: hypothetical protein VFA71_05805 [Terriglobales bacterium]|nr:hypothetical protein [Terriglobales bacterium]
MKQTLVVVLLSLGLALSAGADVTVKQTTTGKGLGMSGNAPATTYIKGHKMRSDVVMGDKTHTTIYDIDAQKMYIFDSSKKEADVWDMAAFAQQISKNVDLSSMKASLTPNGQHKQIAGATANGYDMLVSVNSAMNGNQQMMMTVTVQGPVWIVKNAPGAADYSRFYKAAVEKGWIFTDPRAAKSQPGQAKAMAEMYKQISDIGGIAYESDMQVKMGGEGMMGAIMAKMGNMSFSSVVNTVETGPLSDDLFSPPAGYKLNPKK